jgi:hypothetical protein
MTRQHTILFLAAALLTTACDDPTRPPERAAERTPDAHTRLAQTEASRYRFSGRGADASWYSWTDCTESYASVNGALSRLPEKQTIVSVSVESYDYCTGAWVSAYGETSQATLTVDKQLGGATTTATVTLYDWSNDRTFDVAVDIAWTATGPLVRTRDHYSIRSPGFVQTAKFDGKERYAEASGSISDGVTNFALGTGYGRIFDVKFGERYIARQ